MNDEMNHIHHDHDDDDALHAAAEMDRDALLTAFALGELADDDDAAQRREIEASLADDPAARKHVADVRAIAAELQAEMRGEPALTLTEVQRDRIERGLSRDADVDGNQSDDDHREVRGRTRIIYTISRTLWFAGGFATAAVLSAAIVLPMMDRANEGAGAYAFTDSLLEMERSRLDGSREAGRERAFAPAEEKAGVVEQSTRLGLQLHKTEEDAGAADRTQTAAHERTETFAFGATTAAPGTGGSIDPRRNAPADNARQLGEFAGQHPSAIGGPPDGEMRDRNAGERGQPARKLRLDQAGRPAALPPPPPASPSRAQSSARNSSPALSRPPYEGAPGLDLDAAMNGGSGGGGGGFGGGGGGGGGPAGHNDGSIVELNSIQRELQPADFSRENYAFINDNPFIQPYGADALSTFASDVDTASYANVRRFLNNNMLPPPDAVRIEEMVNYFNYDYAPPATSGGDAEHLFAVHLATMPAPWAPDHQLVRVGLKARELDMKNRSATNLVFLIDVSGSMASQEKLPLLKSAMKLMVEQLHGDDRLAIVTYAGQAGVALDSTYVNDTQAIAEVIDRLRAGGSTHGSSGIRQAYDIAQHHYIDGGVNRVILATDGDFNVGVSDDGSLTRLIEEKRESGVFLSVLGFGTGNIQDNKMEALADHGNGNYSYIDSLKEAEKVLVEQATGTLVTVAKDVKFQIEFNPAQVASYRLIGYENRKLAAQDFNDDTKDAGDVGAGHSVTVLYEVVPHGVAAGGALAAMDELKYQPTAGRVIPQTASRDAASNEMLTVKVRYKPLEKEESVKLEVPLRMGERVSPNDADLNFAAAVAAFGMTLRDSPYKGDASFALTEELAIAGAEESASDAERERRAEFIELARKAAALMMPVKEDQR